MEKLLFKSLKHIAILSFGILLMVGCKKGDNGSGNVTPDYYISFKANGVPIKYTSQAIADLSFSSQSGLYDAVLGGNQLGNVTTKSQIGLFIFANNAVSAKTYQDPQKATSSDGSKIAAVMVNYYDDAGNGYLSMGPMVDENGNPLPGVGNVLADAKITFTKITNSLVEGSFSGTVASTDLSNKITITEGKFILRRIQ